MDDNLCAQIRDALDRTDWPSTKHITSYLLDELSTKYAVPESANGNRQRIIEEAIVKAIKRELINEDGVFDAWQYFNAIHNNLIYEYVLFGTDNLRSIVFIDYLRNIHRGNNKTTPLNAQLLTRLVQYIHDICKISSSPDLANPNVPRINRTMSVANRARMLMNEFGMPCHIANGDVFIHESDMKRICTILEKQISQYGGINLINHIIEHLAASGRYDSDLERYHIIAHGDPMGNKFTPSIPFGYLLNLGIKYARAGWRTPEETKSSPLIDNIISIATSIVAVLDVEPYGPWETEHRVGRDAFDMTRSLVLFDANFKIPQIRSSDAEAILNGLFSWIESSRYKKTISVHTLISFGISLCNLINGQHSSVVISRSKLKELCEDRGAFQDILDIFSHHSTPANQHFSTPLDWDKANAIDRPLVKIADQQYLLPLQGWTVCASIEAILSYYRDNYDSFESAMGIQIEALVKETLKNHSVIFKTGRYQEKRGIEPEIDAAIEGDDDIYLIEIKKKSLTRRAIIGSDYHLLTDLWKSLLDSQIQAIRHELNLRRNGHILFSSGECLHLNGRRVEKLSIVLNDFGSLHDRSIIRQILAFFCSCKFAHPDSQINEHLQSLNMKCKTFTQYHNELDKLLGPNHGIPFFDCCFLSLPQLFVSLDNIVGASDLVASLRRGKHITHKSLDYYYERKHVPATKHTRTSCPVITSSHFPK